MGRRPREARQPRTQDWGRAWRNVTAAGVWVLCAGAALVMAAGALLVALRVDESSRGPGDVVSLADRLDLGLLERSRGLVADPVLDVVTPWGLTAMAWLVLGRLLVAAVHRGGRRSQHEVPSSAAA